MKGAKNLKNIILCMLDINNVLIKTLERCRIHIKYKIYEYINIAKLMRQQWADNWLFYIILNHEKRG